MLMLDADAECLMLMLNAIANSVTRTIIKKKEKRKRNPTVISLQYIYQVSSPPATIVHKFGPTTTLTRPYSPHNSSFSISMDTLKYVTYLGTVPFSLYFIFTFYLFFLTFQTFAAVYPSGCPSILPSSLSEK